MLDNFAHKNLPNQELQPNYNFLDLPQFIRPEELNCAYRLLDFHIENGNGSKICMQTFEEIWTYQDLFDKSNQIANPRLRLSCLLTILRKFKYIAHCTE